MSKTLTFLFILLFFTNSSYANDGIRVAVGDATYAKDTIALGSVQFFGKFSDKQKNMFNKLSGIISNDFTFYRKLFSVVSSSISNSMLGSPNYTGLSMSKINYLISLQASCLNLTSGCSVKAILYSIKDEEEMLAIDFPLTSNVIRINAHDIADKFYKKITKKSKSIFKSKIVFVSDRNGTKKNIVKELYIMDFDGENIKQLTYHKGIAIAPAISNDHTQILYSLIKENKRSKKRNINLYVYNTKTNKNQLLSSRPGMNSGAVFLPDGKNIALTISQTGNAEIYIMNLKSRRLRQLTRHYSPDVDPSISINGKTMTFLSGRPGKATVYTMDISKTEKNVVRISYVGQFNATPRFSPNGKEIAFSSWLDNRFDIFRINTPGTQLVRLTKNFGSNEDPSYSPDGEFIIFSSLRVFKQKRISQNIYLMDRNGEIIKPLTTNFGNCITARWSH